ncbi:potassium uptake channel [Streptomyces viridochromogenes DSM 40736]|uniref:Potassium uptake channel n=1 Tax=Streptomyces viridochromogenes (strain DSM 40736 / JCM 4977 / BCRC 1201 / Tue 494) TaxID=591159 RepID=D9XHS3_STRVT|nr:NAD-binding protein [Streptomyces viridochromogenes]EFL37102.1 potassium uptake channel [Streptomyces viridochromogenes DSM 40736]
MSPRTPHDDTHPHAPALATAAAPAPAPGQHVVVIEDDEALGGTTAARISRWGSTADRLSRPDDDALRRRLREPADGIVIVSRDDIVALRYALLAEHLKPGVRLVVTIFDRTVADEVSRTVPNCTVLSTTDVIVPSLLASCLAPRYAMLLPAGDDVVGVRREGRTAVVERVPRRALTAGGRSRPRGTFPAWFRSLGASARALVASFAALLTVLALDVTLGVLVLHEHWTDATWHAARTLTTIGSSPAAEHGPGWYKIFSAASMLLALVLAAVFTASVVDRFTGHRMTTILGARSIPRRGHVVVVGLGQVGLRLSAQLRRLGLRVVAVERNPHAPCLPLARALGIPVVLGRGGDRFLLERLCVRRARALAAVASDGLENIAVAVTTRAVAADQRIVLRAGGDEVTTESRSLFRIGAVCDVTHIVATSVALSVLDAAPLSVFVADDRTCALFPGDRVVDLAAWDTERERQLSPD